MKMDYNPWPCGKVPEKWQRREIKELRDRGYDIGDMEVIELLEKKIADFAGSKYGIAISSATNAIFLCLEYLKYIGELKEGDEITIPSRTYMSVPMSIVNSRLKINFEDIEWSGLYQLKPTRIYDASVRFTKNMFTGGNSLHILSCQYKKRLPIGRGGIILTDDKDAYNWLIQARFNGRHHDIDQWHDVMDIRGWNMYMSPDDAARGIIIFDDLMKDCEEYPDSATHINYPDLSNQKVFK